MSGSSRALALQAAAVLVATKAGLRAVGFRRWKALLVRLTSRLDGSTAAADPVRIETAQEIARIQEAVFRHLTFRVNCLERSLVLWWVLSRRGIPAGLRIGARKQAGRFEAHAWVELGSLVLNDFGEAHLHFVPFDGSIISMETQPH